MPAQGRTPPLVSTIRNVGLALAGAVGMWALSAGLLDYATLKAVRDMKAKADTVFVTDTIHDCIPSDDQQRPDTRGGPVPPLF